MSDDTATTTYDKRYAPEATVKVEKAWWRIHLLGRLCVSLLPRAAFVLNAEDAPETAPQTAFDSFPTHKAALLFARLALHPRRTYGRDELADWLWPDLPADKGRANLSKTLHRLKTPFAASCGSGGEPNVSLFTSDYQTVRARAEAFQTDVALFEQKVHEAERARGASPAESAARWRAAVESYGGELLPGFYDEWIEQERQRLRDLFDSACAKCSEAERVAQTAAPTKTQQQQTVVTDPRTVGFPLTLTRFFGRDAERADLCARLTQTDPPARLITLTGAGGMGKTRLAIQAAQKIGEVFALAAFASLADVSDADRIAAALVQRLLHNTREKIQDTDDPLSLVTDFLQRAGGENGGGNGRVLLVLDNLEQFGEAGAPVVSYLLARVPCLTVLATSRQPVGVSGEQEISLGPLAAKTSANEALPPDVELFVDRARLVRPQFALTPQNTASVCELCKLLEGVPLAIELAAAWVRTLSPAQIIERLCRRFELLQRKGMVGGDLPKRHQSLHATIAWSYDLLPPSLQTFWAQLSVFRGGWTVEAARAVTEVEDVAEQLLLLTERSLIIVDEDEATGATRYRMLESLRAFAGEQAEARGRDFYDGLRLRHAQYFEELSRRGEQILHLGSGNRPAMALLGPECDNIRAALRFTLEPPTAPNRADNTVLVTGIRLVLQSASIRSVGEQAAYLEQAVALTLSLPDETGLPLRARVLSEQGHTATFLGDFGAAKQKISESSAIWKALGEEQETITNKKRLSGIAWRTGNAEEALSLLIECLDAARRNNDPKAEAGILNNLAVCGGGRPERWDWITRSVALYREHMPHSYLMAMALNSMGGIALQNGDFETARPYLEEAHDLAVAEGAAGMLGVTKEILANLFLTTGEHLDRAAQLLREARQIFEEKGEPPRVAEAHRLSFHVALRRGDFNGALVFARDYLTVNHDARLMDAAELSYARADLTKQLREAGYETVPHDLGACLTSVQGSR